MHPICDITSNAVAKKGRLTVYKCPDKFMEPTQLNAEETLYRSK
jgi:hypothetical protein